MSSDKATAILALVEAERALQLASRAFLKLNDPQSAALMREMAADSNTLIEALARSERPAAGAVLS